jgi:ribosomal protein L37AE/L43A
VTLKLSHAKWIVHVTKTFELEVTMNDTTCPWCETELVLRLVGDEQTCRECGTTWSYEDGIEEALPLAA